ncbi:MAG: STAS domain-containing protein [Candidatus Riflebacteria bacterium]|nr:STAS domain-containing protein [Candidatus Riflebacteria bacterium]
MKIEKSGSSDSIRLVIDGSIDERGAQEMKDVFEGLNFSGIKSIVLDFKKVDHIGSSGLGKLLLLYKRTATAGVEVRIEHISSEIHQLLKGVKIDGLFKLS